MLKKGVFLIIRFYQFFISPWLGSNCIYYPTCSDYMMHSVDKNGFIKGILTGAWRILRCNPLATGGYDPVNPAKTNSEYSD